MNEDNLVSSFSLHPSACRLHPTAFTCDARAAINELENRNGNVTETMVHLLW